MIFIEDVGHHKIFIEEEITGRISAVFTAVALKIYEK